MKYTGKEGFKRKLEEYGPRIAIADGDNWPAIKLLLPEIQLYHPSSKHEGKPILITGNEKKRVRGKKGGILAWLNGKEYPQPVMVYLNEHFIRGEESPYFSVMRPQEFPRNLKEGKIAVAIGAGYDLQIDRTTEWDEIGKIRLNGELKDPEKRYEVMRKELERCGYYGIPTGIKPVVYTLITSRDSGIRELKDIERLVKRGEKLMIISEAPKITKAYFIQHGIDINVAQSDGSVDNQIICGLYKIGSEIVESGKTLDDNIEYVRLVEKAGEPVIITYSCACVVTTSEEYKKEKTFMDEFFGRIEENTKHLRKKEPELFEERYLNFFPRFKERERELYGETNPVFSLNRAVC